jgi:hypothetical protein
VQVRAPVTVQLLAFALIGVTKRAGKQAPE